MSLAHAKMVIVTIDKNWWTRKAYVGREKPNVLSNRLDMGCVRRMAFWDAHLERWCSYLLIWGTLEEDNIWEEYHKFVLGRTESEVTLRHSSGDVEWLIGYILGEV